MNQITTASILVISKKAKFIQRLLAADYAEEGLVELSLEELQAMCNDLEPATRITETYCNANGTVSRRVTERKAA